MSNRLNHDDFSTLPEEQESRALKAPHAGAARGLMALLGLELPAAFLAILVDLMVFGVDTFSLETLFPLGVATAGVLSFIVYKIQRKAGDDHDYALIKALSIGLLTAIPVPLTPLVAIPGGLLGIVNTLRRK